jgi:hypothetical protein
MEIRRSKTARQNSLEAFPTIMLHDSSQAFRKVPLKFI